MEVLGPGATDLVDDVVTDPLADRLYPLKSARQLTEGACRHLQQRIGLTVAARPDIGDHLDRQGGDRHFRLESGGGRIVDLHRGVVTHLEVARPATRLRQPIEPGRMQSEGEWRRRSDVNVLALDGLPRMIGGLDFEHIVGVAARHIIEFTVDLEGFHLE